MTSISAISIRSIAIDRPLDPSLIDPVLTGRFRADIDQLWAQNERLGLAISGGPDSMALLALCHAIRPGSIEAVTVDHGLRAESAAEAEQVARICADLGVPHQILRITVAEGNVQQEARLARYAAMEDWLNRQEIGCLATAHHADDQAETFLMRLGRGSGVAGLAGVRKDSVVPGGTRRLIRPLLNWRKAELVQVTDGAGLGYVTDPSNADLSFDRVRMRQQLAETQWLDPQAISASAAYLAEADAAIEWMAEQEWSGRVRRIGQRHIYRPFAPPIVQMRIAARLLKAISGKQPRGSVVADLITRLSAGESGNAGGVLVTIVGDAWRFEKEPPRRPQEP